jgi:hypothetical protein
MADPLLIAIKKRDLGAMRDLLEVTRDNENYLEAAVGNYDALEMLLEAGFRRGIWRAIDHAAAFVKPCSWCAHRDGNEVDENDIFYDECEDHYHLMLRLLRRYL